MSVSESYKVISTSFKSCGCGSEQLESFNPPLFSKPKDIKCLVCNETAHYKKNKFVFQNAITIHIQDNEKFNDIDKIICILLDVDTDNIRLGEKINVLGDLHVQSKKGLLVPQVFSSQIEYENKDEVILTEIDVKAIKRFTALNGDSIIDSLVDMFDRSIINNNVAKEALLYGLVNTRDDLLEIKQKRGRERINVLLAGQPGQAKSSLLKKAVTLIPNSRYESIQHSSGKSLTAIVLKEDEQHSLRLGPIPVAKGSVCGLNEIGTMKEDDQNFLLDIMEEGEFTINKYGFNSKIHSPTTIIASTNLNNSWISSNFKISLDNLPLQKPLLDRFDLIVVLKDSGDMKALKEYTEEKVGLISRPIPMYDSYLQKHIAFARKKNPQFSSEANQMIQEYDINLNECNSNLTSKRTLETIFRLVKAVAKLRLKDVVDGRRCYSYYKIL